jgi:hypothetical protein
MVDLRKNWRELSARLIAEFAIVVLGVTIALWADSWVTAREDRAEETARLHALQDNVTTTLADLRDEIENSTGAIDALRKLVGQGDLPHDEVRGLLRYGLLYGPNFSPELNVYDDLKNSGELALLTDRRLRQALARMDAQLKRFQLAQVDLASVQLLDIDSYLIDETDLRPLYGTDLGLDWTTVNGQRDFEFVADTRFRNRVLLKLDLVSGIQSGLTDVETALVEVQQSIRGLL